MLVEYRDGSFQWLENALEAEVARMPGVARIKSYCNPNFRVTTERWTTGRSDMEKIVIAPVVASCDRERGRK
jgi:hypothetical protein